MADPQNAATTYAYDVLNRLKTLTFNGGIIGSTTGKLFLNGDVTVKATGRATKVISLSRFLISVTQ